MALKSNYDLVINDISIGLELETESPPINERLEVSNQSSIRSVTLNTYRSWFWKIVSEGSLRRNGREYVLDRPLSGLTLIKAVKSLEEFLTRIAGDPDYTLRPKPRSSLHVHIDMSIFDDEDVKKIFVLSVAFDRQLFNYAGKSRKSVSFCTPISQHPEGVCLLDENFIAENNMHHLSISPSALFKYGSLEYRHHREEWSARRILRWINILLSIVKFAVEMRGDSRTMIHYVSKADRKSLINQIFGEYSRYILHKFDEDEFVEDVATATEIALGKDLHRFWWRRKHLRSKCPC